MGYVSLPEGSGLGPGGLDSWDSLGFAGSSMPGKSDPNIFSIYSPK